MNTTKNRAMRTLVLLLTLGLSGAALEPAHGQMADSRSTGKGINAEPLLVYDVSGFGIAGPMHQHLAIYSNGLTSISTLSPVGQSSEFTWVSPHFTGEINSLLIEAGALELRDRRSKNSADIPMTTVTVFDGSGPNAAHNVFSFYALGQPDDYQVIVEIVDAFTKIAFTN